MHAFAQFHVISIDALSMHELQTRNVQVIDPKYSRESERLPNMVTDKPFTWCYLTKFVNHLQLLRLQ